MTNLNAIIQTYFIDISVDKIFDSIGTTGGNQAFFGLNCREFEENFLQHNTMYGTDVVKSIYNLSNDFWLIDESGEKNVFNILKNATDKTIIWEDENPICIFDEFLKWNDISSLIGEDAFTTASLANKNVFKDLVEQKSFAWKPHITSNAIDVNELINEDLYELHYHKFGSSLCFDINWIAIMNEVHFDKDAKRTLKAIDPNLQRDIVKAAAIRLFLFNELNKLSLNITESQLSRLIHDNNALPVSSLFNQYFKRQIAIAQAKSLHFDKDVFDYAITPDVSLKDIKRYYNVPLIGERKLLYKAFKSIYEGDKQFDPFKSYFYAYLVIKTKVRQIFVQDPFTKGFSNFDSFDQRKKLFIKGKTKYLNFFSFVSVQTTIGNQSIKGLEMRMAPKMTSQELVNAVRNENKITQNEKFRLFQKNIINERNTKIGYVIHFIKNPEKCSHKSILIGCRNQMLRETLDAQADAIANLVMKNSAYIQGGIVPRRLAEKNERIYPIIGIDAANSEFNCRPEVFGNVFRRLKNIKRLNKLDCLFERHDCQLGRTFHVGEDYYDIIDGLRAIDECLFFLNFGEGDRIGHAVALGIDSHKYYKTRNYTIILPKQILLDNAVWFINKMDTYSIADRNGLRQRLKDVFNLYFYDIFKMEAPSIQEYYQSWKLRGDDPRAFVKEQSKLKPYLINNLTPDLDLIRKNVKVTELFKKYHEQECLLEGDKPVEFKFEDSDTLVIDEIQQRMREEVFKKRISIETNPTSNIKITDVERYSKHPIIKFNNYGLVQNPDQVQIDVSINTDDQGVFATSLEKEFTLMACALSKKINDEDGKPAYTKNDIYNWLNNIRKIAKRNSFIKIVD